NGITNVEVLYNGIPIPEPEPPYIENNSKIIFFPGRTSYAKGVYALLDAFLLIKKEIPGARVFIAGATEKGKKEIARYMKKVSIDEEDIKILGWISNEEVHKIYDKISVVATPSICADFLLGVNLEAAAHKRPVVTTCFGGAKEFVLDGETGYVVNPYDKKELADKIIDILLDNDKARRFGGASFKRLKEKFSIGVHVDKLLKFYNEFI
ncbi:MAG: glycosyltransferase family 4 protein, partial [Patescibacteria group bacterium]